MLTSKAFLYGNEFVNSPHVGKWSGHSVYKSTRCVNRPETANSHSTVNSSNADNIKNNSAGESINSERNSPAHQESTASEKFFIQPNSVVQQDRNKVVYHAVTMEKARLRLFKTLLQTTEALTILAHEYLSRIGQGYDTSEIFSIKYGMQELDANHDEQLGQIKVKQYESQLAAAFRKIVGAPDSENFRHNDPNHFNFITQIHFLPVFLQRVATCVMDSSQISQVDKAQINQQLRLMVESRQIFVTSNVRLVYFIANQYTYCKLSFSDLVQEGSVGLIKAIDRFEYNRSIQFSTYAIYWIRQTISRAIIRQKKMVRLPYNLAPKSSVVFKSINTHLQQTNRRPSSLKLAELCQLSKKEIETILQFNQPNISLSSSVHHDEGPPNLIDTLVQTHFPSPFVSLATIALHTTLIRAINSLPKREADVLCARFGINKATEMTLQDIADQLHISRERVRQIQNIALQKIRAVYGDELRYFLTPDPA